MNTKLAYPPPAATTVYASPTIPAATRGPIAPVGWRLRVAMPPTGEVSSWAPLQNATPVMIAARMAPLRRRWSLWYARPTAAPSSRSLELGKDHGMCPAVILLGTHLNT